MKESIKGTELLRDGKLPKLRMPGEFEKHRGTLLIWPVRPGSWGKDASKAKKAFCCIMELLLRSEEVFLLVNPKDIQEAEAMAPKGVKILPIETDDAWARDVGPTFVKDAEGKIYGIDWEFNAWGGSVDGLYANWERDDRAASRFCELLDYPIIDAHPFILEGGSIHSDGEGTLMTTESCLLSAGRNSGMSKEEIEATLCKYLGGEKVLWLPRGIYNDETNEHVDNVCAFVRPGEVVLAWTEDPEDPQYAMSKACYEYLSKERDAKGREILIHKLPIPKRPILITEEDLKGYEFEEGEDERELGERLAASYVNFYISNASVLVPAFGDEGDEIARKILADCFPEREVISVDAREILLGGGNIHCITQQVLA